MCEIVIKPEVKDFLQALHAEQRSYLIGVIKAKAERTDEQMVVVSWTCDGSWPFIERCMKDYRYKPGIRILFHVVKRGQKICVDRMCWRDQDPYMDGH